MSCCESAARRWRPAVRSGFRLAVVAGLSLAGVHAVLPALAAAAQEAESVFDEVAAEPSCAEFVSTHVAPGDALAADADVLTAAGPAPDAPTAAPDLDATYIERTPRYYRYCVNYTNAGNVTIPSLCPGTENNKRWPASGEAVTYKAHVRNKGDAASAGFGYRWLVNGAVVASGTYSGSLAVGAEVVFQYATTWSTTPKTVRFEADHAGTVAESVETNNGLTIGTHDLTISYWVEQGLYNIFNATTNMAGSRSFEDWVQAHVAKLNERFAQAQYGVAPTGARDRVRIDKIVVATQLDGSSSPMNSDPDLYLIDGRWQSTDGDPTNAAGQGGAWQNYVNQYALTIDYGLLHEVAHQMGVIDLYRLNLANDPANNNRFQVKGLNGQVIPVTSLPTYAWNQVLFQYPGLMGGGSTSPYNNTTYFESHTAAGMNSHYNKRRGFYGEYLYDTPTTNYLKVVNSAGQPLGGLNVALYQRDPVSEGFDDVPEISGVTDSAGLLLLPNRAVTGVTTATGHTLKANPFGQISVTGTNGTLFLRIHNGSQESYHFLFLLDLNLAYWAGNTGTATHTFTTSVAPAPLSTTTPASVTVCPGTSHTFSTTASGGNGSYSYQWYEWNCTGSCSWKPVGTNAKTYTTNLVRTFYVRVTSCGGGCAVNSGQFSLANYPAVATTTPATVTVPPGTYHTFSVTASGGNGSYSYQWYEWNCTGSCSWKPVGTNSRTYTTNLVRSYYVAVTSCGQLVSTGVFELRN